MIQMLNTKFGTSAVFEIMMIAHTLTNHLQCDSPIQGTLRQVNPLKSSFRKFYLETIFSIAYMQQEM